MKKAGRTKISPVILLITLGAGAASYAYHASREVIEARARRPRPQCQQLIADLRRFSRLRSRFPENLREVELEFWRGRPGLALSSDGLGVRAGNYYYRYQRVRPDKCVFWALPTGPRRDSGRTFFVVVAEGWERTWEGAALPQGQFDKLPAVPSLEDLADANLAEGVR